MSQLQLKDGSFREFILGQSAAEIVKGIGMGLYKAACCVKINGEVCDLRTPVTEDCTFEVCTFDDPDGKKTFWHTASHVLAQAVKRLYPNAKLAIGPAIDSGFYYDFDVEKPFTAEELRKIEAEMKKIVKENAELEQFTLSPDEAISFLKEQDEPYKVELCEEHAGKGEPISFYRQGPLCWSTPDENRCHQGIQAALLHRCLLERLGKEQDALSCLCHRFPESFHAG